MVSKRAISLILSLIGVGGVAATSFLSVKCSKKADTKETKKDKVIAYAPAIISGVVTSGCILGSHHISAKEIAALTASCTYLAANRDKIERKVQEKFGREGLLDIKKEVAKEETTNTKALATTETRKPKDHFKEGQTIESTGHGNTLFVDLYLGRKFRSSLQHVEWAERQMNNEFHDGKYVSMNDFYGYLGIDKTYAGEEFGWPANDDYYDYHLDEPIHFENIKGEDDDGELMYVIDIGYGSYPMAGWNEV